METYQKLITQALGQLKSAERALRFTYPLVKENKVLLTVAEHLFMAFSKGMGSVLHYELLHKRIPVFEEHFESKYQLMRTKILEQYHIEADLMKLARDLKDIMIAHRDSPVEFSRGDKFVICQDNYELKELSAKSLENALEKTKLFIEQVSHIIKLT